MNLQRALAVLVLLAAGLAQGAAPPALLTQEQTKQLREAERLWARMVQEHKAGNLAAAEATHRKVLAMVEPIYGTDHIDVAHGLQWLAQLCEAQGKWKEAIAAWQRRAGVMARLFGHEHWKAIDARQDAADSRLRSWLTPEQRDSWQRAMTIDQRVAQLRRQGKAGDALPLAKQAVEICRNLLGEKHPHYATTLSNLAMLHHALGDDRQALLLLQRALRLFKEALGETHPHYAMSLNNLALLYRDMGDRRQALPLFRQTLRLRREVLGERHPDSVKSLNNLALLYHDMGEHRHALPLFRQSLRLTRELFGQTHPAYASALNNLAGHFQAVGDHRQALSLLQQALRTPQVGHRLYDPNILTNLAKLYQDMGEHRKALPLFGQARDLYKAILGENSLEYATALGNLASLYRDMGDHRQALPLARRSLALTRKVLGENHADYATSLNNLGLLYREMKDDRQALPLLEETLRLRKKLLREGHPNQAASLNNLAALYRHMGNPRRALPLLEESLRLRKKVQGENHPHYAAALHNLAELHLDLGEPRQAFPLLQRALRLTGQTLGEKHPDYATCLRNLAGLYHATGKGGAPPVLSGQALAVLRAQLQDTFSVLSDRQRQQLLHKHASALEAFLAMGIGVVPASGLFEQVAGFKDMGSISIAEQRLARQNPALRPALVQLQLVRAELAHHSGQLPAGKEFSRWRDRFDDLDRRKTELERLLADKSAGFARLHQKPTAARIAANLPARAALVEFLVYLHPLGRHRGVWICEPRLLAFVLRPDRECVLVEPGHADRIFGAVRLWRRSLAGSELSGLDTSAELLRRHLWQPIAPHLDGIDTVLIAPDGDLAGLPFAALPGDKPGTFLVEKYAFGYLSSGRQLLMPFSTVKGDGLLVLGGAEFGKPQETDARQLPRSWGPLPGAALEAQQVKGAFAARFRDARLNVLSGRRADRVRLLAALDPARTGKHWRYLHLATHGHFDPPRYALPPAVLGGWSVGSAAAPGLAGLMGGLTATLVAQEPGVLSLEYGFDPTGQRYRIQEANPMLLCRLVLAGVNDVGHEASLSAEEVALLELDGCELAVLSACETSAGRQAGWQGVQGLQRGFHQAGARHVLASLWSVNDPATSVLMEEFYRLLWAKKETPLQALRQAQLFVLRNPDKVIARARELEKRLAKSNLSKAVLIERGIRPKAREAGTQPGKSAQSPIAWWAPWVLSGTPVR